MAPPIKPLLVAITCVMPMTRKLLLAALGWWTDAKNLPTIAEIAMSDEPLLRN